MTEAANIDRQIRDVIARWLDAVGRKDAAAIAQFYAPDGRFLVPNAPVAEGRGPIATMWSNMLSLPSVVLKFPPTVIEAAASGELAYEVGTYTLHFEKGGRRVEDRGKYVVVWKRIDGAWKVA